MMRYSIEPRDQMFVKGYGFLSFATNLSKNIGKNISKSLSGKYSQKLLDHAKQYATDALTTTSKRITQNTAEATSDFIGDKNADKRAKVSRSSLQKSSVTVENETENVGFGKEIPRERYISPQKGKLIII